MAQIPLSTSMATYSPSWSASTCALTSRLYISSPRRAVSSLGLRWRAAVPESAIRAPFVSLFHTEQSMTTCDFGTTKRPRTRDLEQEKDRLAAGKRIPLARRLAWLLGLCSTVPARYTAGIAIPWCADSLPSHISKMAAFAVSGGGIYLGDQKPRQSSRRLGPCINR